ncbi:MAG: alginate lyase [Melioribacteraceae bacterium]|nr:MAG: alginate lyase [Melioribacteraceae bacterium]
MIKNMNKIFLAAAILSSLLGAQADMLYSSPELLEAAKQNKTNRFVKLVIEVADENFGSEIKTITSVTSPMGEEHLHDYFSEGPYWWPNPEDPDGPYIRHDGKRNPERFGDHKELHMSFYRAVTSLSIAAYLTGEKKYADRALEFIEQWWIDENTKMAPHLKYAQIIRNKPVRRGVGIIETHRYVGLIESLLLLESTGFVPSEKQKDMKRWWTDYYSWLTESEWGIDEEERGNNHSSWWAAQAAAIAYYLGKTDDLEKYYEYGKSYLIDRQISENCEQPLEDGRTLSLNYNVFNLDALSFLSAVLKKTGKDLFMYKGNGCTIEGAAERIIPFIENPDEWKLDQIKPHKQIPRPFMFLAGMNYNNNMLLEAYRKLLTKDTRDLSILYTDPFDLLLDAQMFEMETNK